MEGSAESATVDAASPPPSSPPSGSAPEPLSNPADWPKLKLDILGIVHTAQSAHGLRRNVPDYLRYRHFCTAKLRRLRRNLRFNYGKKKFTWHVLTPAVAKKDQHLVVALMNAERAWAYFLDLQREQEQVKDDNTRIKASPPVVRIYTLTDCAASQFHALKRLRKASEWATQLRHLCEVRADERTTLEATGYQLWMAGLLARELGQWVEAGQALQKAWAIFEGLAKVGDSATRAIAKGRADNIQPLVAYCAYRGGVDVASFSSSSSSSSSSSTSASEAAAAASAPAAGGAALLDTYLVNSRRAEAQQAAVELDGGARRCAVDPQSPLGALIVQCRFRELESSGGAVSSSDASAAEGALNALLRQCKDAEEWLALAGRVAGAAAERGKTATLSEADLGIVRDWARLQEVAARNRRNDLLIDIAVVRCVMDATGAPATYADVLSGDARWRALVESARAAPDASAAFASATAEWLGTSPLSWTGVARMLDQMVAVLLGDRAAADEDARRAAAAVVTQYRAARALLLALPLCDAARWPEALALSVKAAQTLRESQALLTGGNSSSGAGAASTTNSAINSIRDAVARWSVVAAHLLRMIRVRANAGAAAAAAPVAEPEPLESADDSATDSLTMAVPGKVTLFDLAGSDVRFPSLEGRVKKKGFLSSWW